MTAIRSFSLVHICMYYVCMYVVCMHTEIAYYITGFLKQLLHNTGEGGWGSRHTNFRTSELMLKSRIRACIIVICFNSSVKSASLYNTLWPRIFRATSYMNT